MLLTRFASLVGGGGRQIGGVLMIYRISSLSVIADRLVILTRTAG